MNFSSSLLVTLVSLGLGSVCAQGQQPAAGKFDFGSSNVMPGWTKVTPETVYTPELGYGFDLGTTPTAVDRGGNDPVKDGYCTSEKPFFFSVKLPEGNYRVTVMLGDATGETSTTIKSEMRRLMVEHVQTKPGQFETRTFLVNVRTPSISEGVIVKLKDREKNSEMINWDDKLTLEFNDTRPAVAALEIAPANDAVAVYLLGDSTVCDQPNEPWNSWGQMLPRFLQAPVVVANYAQSGESLRSSRGAKRLEKVLSRLKKGDYVFVQFGHNDMKEKGEGVGAFTTYKTDLIHYLTEVKKRGGLPVAVTPVNRRSFDPQGQVTNSLRDYPEAVRQAGQEEGVPVIDLNAMSKIFYEAMGPENSKRAFQDGTHHNNYGSYELAKCVAEGIKANKLGLAQFIVKEMGAFDPAKPDLFEDFKMPASPMSAAAKPDGN